MKKQNIRTLLLIVVTFVYLLIGAGIFEALESRNEVDEEISLFEQQQSLCSKYNISNKDFDEIVKTVTQSEPHSAGIQWKFTGAFYFATTVITTIGYGHSTPKTVGGKIFCMLYAMAGIPLNIVMFQSLGERLNILIMYLLRSAKKCLRFKNVNVSQTLLILISMQMSTAVVFGGAWAFSHYEAWSYLDSFYYCVITLTTVGFGDFVAMQNKTLQNRPEYVAFSIFFILFGLAVVSSALNLLVLRFLTLNTQDERRDAQLDAIRRSTIQLASGVMAINGGGMLSIGAMMGQAPGGHPPHGASGGGLGFGGGGMGHAGSGKFMGSAPAAQPLLGAAGGGFGMGQTGAGKSVNKLPVSASGLNARDSISASAVASRLSCGDRPRRVDFAMTTTTTTTVTTTTNMATTTTTSTASPSTTMQTCFCCDLTALRRRGDIRAASFSGSAARQRYRVTRPPTDKVEHLVELSLHSEVSGEGWVGGGGWGREEAGESGRRKEGGGEGGEMILFREFYQHELHRQQLEQQQQPQQHQHRQQQQQHQEQQRQVINVENPQRELLLL